MGQVQWRAEVWFSPRLTYRSKCPPHLAPLNPSKCLSIILFFGLPSKDMGGHRAVTTSSVRHCGNTLSKPNEGPYSWLISLRGLSNVPVWRINALKLDMSHFCLVTSSIQTPTPPLGTEPTLTRARCPVNVTWSTQIWRSPVTSINRPGTEKLRDAPMNGWSVCQYVGWLFVLFPVCSRIVTTLI